MRVARPTPSVVISIVSHPGGDARFHAPMLDDCLMSLRKSTRQVTCRVVLTNNLKGVDLFRHMQQLTGDETLVVNETPAGFAANHNRVLAGAPEPFAFILNDDTVVLDGAIDALVDALAREPRVAIAGPRVYADLSRIEVQPTAGTRVMSPERALLWRLIRETPLIGLPRLRPIYRELELLPAPQRVKHLQGSAMMVRTEAYRQVGGMDEGYGMYREETDLCLELRRHGWGILYHPKATIVHFGGASTSESKYRDQYQESLDRFLRKHYGWRAAFVNGVVEPPLLAAVRATRRALRWRPWRTSHTERE